MVARGPALKMQTASWCLSMHSRSFFFMIAKQREKAGAGDVQERVSWLKWETGFYLSNSKLPNTFQVLQGS
jgi:hypothetical protein